MKNYPYDNKSIDHFLDYTQLPNIGLDIILKKNIPIGGGLGGGSSNAATCLIALNEIYETKLSAIQLKRIARQIGCDVPFFLHQKNAWVEGTGDIITPIFVKPTWLVMIFSKQNISTSDIFSKYTHKNHFREFSYDDYLENNTINDFEEIESTLFFLGWIKPIILLVFILSLIISMYLGSKIFSGTVV